MRFRIATLIAALSTPAFAADLAVVYPEPPAAHPAAARFDWNGLYFGVNGGWGWGELDWTYAIDPDATADHSTDGGLIGATLGYNVDVNGLLLGAEADFGWADIDGRTDCPNPAFSCKSELESFGTVRGRLGWTTGRLALFGTGGVAFGEQRIETTLPGFSIPPSGKPTNGSSETVFGWTAGLGAEYAFARRWSGKIEWLYFDFGQETYKVDNGLKVKADQSGSIVRIGLNYQLN
jgi:outer membrane immunogenic protein